MLYLAPEGGEFKNTEGTEREGPFRPEKKKNAAKKKTEKKQKENWSKSREEVAQMREETRNEPR